MGAGLSFLLHRLFGGGEYKIVMVGLDNAGKSTILYRLCASARLMPFLSRALRILRVCWRAHVVPNTGTLATSFRPILRLGVTSRR